MDAMPLEDLAAWCLQEPSESIDDGEGVSGWGGGELDTTSGVLTLKYTPHDETNAPDVVQRFEQTTARFVEVEKLLDVLTKYPVSRHMNRHTMRGFLCEVLDAHEL